VSWQRGGVHVSVRRVVPGAAVLRAARLMDMLYRPSELAEELRIQKRAVYDVLIPLGLPHERDEHGHIWLHGPAVREWLETATRGPKCELADGELFCLKCFEPRSPSRHHPLAGAELVRNGRFVMIRATCPVCGAEMYKGVGKRVARRLAASGLIDEEDLEVFDV